MVLLQSVFLFLFLGIVSAVSRPRGVSLEKASFYTGGTVFKCLSNGLSIPMEHVNDDYCDCEDGSDEPGTSACSNGLFFCENKLFKGSYIISSRVNDGICDCCDGSDEYDGTITCPNKCQELYAAVMAQQQAFRQKEEQGYKVKMDFIQQGKRTKDEKLTRLSELEKEKEVLVQERDAAEAIKEEAEIPEKDAKDKHEKAWEVVKDERRKAKEAVAAAGAFTELDVNQDGSVDLSEIQKHLEFDIDSDGTVSDEEAREYLEDSEGVDVTVFTEKIWPNIKEIFKSAASADENVPEDGAGGEQVKPADEETEATDPDKVLPDDIVEGGSKADVEHDFGKGDTNEDVDDEDDEEEEDGDDDDEYDDDDLDAAYDLNRRGRRNKNLGENADDEDKMPDYDEETKKLINAADETRKKFDETNKKVQDTENEISGIKTYLELDFGPNEEFAVMRGQCFEYTDREYTYKFCPFDKASQRPKGGGMETTLGNWGHWHGPEEDKYDAMKFEKGQACWNGPSRTCHVNFHCGVENALIGASEPSRCEYQFEFTTPSRCQQPSASSLPNVHEEL